MSLRRREKDQVKGSDKIIVVKGVAPKSGTELTRERMSESLRSLNSSWTKESARDRADS